MEIKVINDKCVQVKIGDWTVDIDDSTGERVISEHRDAMLIKNNEQKWKVYDE